jgi:hypothetical protein
MNITHSAPGSMDDTLTAHVFYSNSGVRLIGHHVLEYLKKRVVVTAEFDSRDESYSWILVRIQSRYCRLDPDPPDVIRLFTRSFRSILLHGPTRTGSAITHTHKRLPIFPFQLRSLEERNILMGRRGSFVLWPSGLQDRVGV